MLDSEVDGLGDGFSKFLKQSWQSFLPTPAPNSFYAPKICHKHHKRQRLQYAELGYPAVIVVEVRQILLKLPG